MRKTLDLPDRPCKCGCGFQFKPVRRDQRFVNAEHRKRYHAEEMVTVRRGDLEVAVNCMRWECFDNDDLEIRARLETALEKK